MFKSIKKVFGLATKNESKPSEKPASSSPASRLLGNTKTSEWAQLPAASEDGKSLRAEGQIHGRTWRIEQGKPSRDFIKGLELRARGEMNVREEVAVMIMSRSLKNELDQRAFALYTDTLQTQMDPNLPEEMRWLAVYEEVGWEALGHDFLDHYAVLADQRKNAMSWATPEVTELLMAWPSKVPEVPMVLMVLRGKVYLRMQISQGDLATAEHASRVFQWACEAAVNAFGTDLAL